MILQSIKSKFFLLVLPSCCFLGLSSCLFKHKGSTFFTLCQFKVRVVGSNLAFLPLVFFFDFNFLLFSLMACLFGEHIWHWSDFTVGFTLKNYSWQYSECHMVCWRSNLGLAFYKASTLFTILLLWLCLLSCNLNLIGLCHHQS